MGRKWSKEDLRDLLVLGTQDVRKQLEEALKKHLENTFELAIEDESLGIGTYTVAKTCPEKSHLCEWQPDGMEGVNCGFYNGIKKKCVYPRTCTHNIASEHFLNLYDKFMGNIGRYWDVADNQKATNQIIAKLKERNIIPQEEDTGGFGPDAYEGWAYAEFEDDGQKVTLVELATDKEASKIIAEREKIEDNQQILKVNQMKSELDGLLLKYSGDTRKDIDRIVELSRQIYGGE